MEAYQPDCVLVEGPENANHLLPLLTAPEGRPPLAFYYALRDEKGLLGEKETFYKCYYPFLDCSPELAALRWAGRSGGPVYRLALWPHFAGLREGPRLAASGRAAVIPGRGLLQRQRILGAAL